MPGLVSIHGSMALLRRIFELAMRGSVYGEESSCSDFLNFGNLSFSLLRQEYFTILTDAR